MPPASVTHNYDSRDLAARAALIRAARRILRRAGALKTYSHPIRTFSHALGTVRLGTDPRTAPLDEWGGVRGLDNLFVTDASALPRSGGRQSVPDDRGQRIADRPSPGREAVA